METLLPASLLELLNEGSPALVAAQESVAYIHEKLPGLDSIFRRRGILFDAKEICWLAPLPRPGKIICVAGNYPSLAGTQDRPEFPTLFLKPSSSVVGPDHPVYLSPLTREVAYEAELALVIGRRGRWLSEEEAVSYVAGCTIANDLGDRALEKRSSQWTSGKLMDTFTPMGPALVTRDEVPDMDHLSIHTTLNGRTVQQGNTGDMFFPVSTLVQYISTLTTLEPGDVILTGSPKRIGTELAPVISLQAGDRVEIEIAGLGRLANPICLEGEKRLE